MDKPQELYRKILLSADIDPNSIQSAINKILEINYDDDVKESQYKEWERKPITIFINSYGGNVCDGLALVDIIKQSKTPVHTVSIGSSMSMGFWIYLAGHKRFVGEHTTLMFHDIYAGAIDKTEGIKQELDFAIRLQNMICDEIVSTSKVKRKMLESFINRKAEWYITADEAVKLKLADDYYRRDNDEKSKH